MVLPARTAFVFAGLAFVRETCLIAANISHIIGEPVSEQQRYMDYAAGTLDNFTKQFYNESAGICTNCSARHRVVHQHVLSIGCSLTCRQFRLRMSDQSCGAQTARQAEG